VQKEVAERLAAEPGDMSILAISAQVYADVHMGVIVPAELFTPPPKVDSAVVVLTMRSSPRIDIANEKKFFRAVKAGFTARRKKLRSSLSGGLGMTKSGTEQLLECAGVSPDARAQDLTIDDWSRIASHLS
jgi:16S rRNA (adenine1518-N6/adenine1519-N6)-dimethyltransferase